jgi:hypothetical protein
LTAAAPSAVLGGFPFDQRRVHAATEESVNKGFQFVPAAVEKACRVEPRLQIGDHAPQQIVDDLGTRRVSLFPAKLADGDNEVGGTA